MEKRSIGSPLVLTALLPLLCFSLAAAAAAPTTERAAPTRPDMTGTVTGPTGKPLSGAMVWVATAAVRKGTSPFCPSCYPDCGRRVTSDARGRFRIPSVDPALTYRLLVVRDGYTPTYVRVDPKKGAVRAALTPRPVRSGAAGNRNFILGTIRDPLGQPVAGATVEIEGEIRGGTHSFGAIDGVDPLAVSDSAGRFRCYVARPESRYLFKVTARGLAPQKVTSPPGVIALIKLQYGAALRGVLRDADNRPMPGVTVHLNQKDRNSETFLGQQQIGTDANGQFLFTNLAPNEEYVVCPAMSDLGRFGTAAPTATVRLPDNGKTFGGLQFQAAPARTVSGRIRLTDGKPVPPGTRVMLGRDGTWDVQFTDASADGRFRFRGVPKDLSDGLDLSVRVRGYRYSSKTPGLEKTTAPIYSIPVRPGLSDVTDWDIVLEPEPRRLR